MDIQENLEDAISPYAALTVVVFLNRTYVDWANHLAEHAAKVNAATRMPLPWHYVDEVAEKVARNSWLMHRGKSALRNQAKKEQQRHAINASILAKHAQQQAIKGLTSDAKVCPCGGMTKPTTIELIDPADKARWLRIPLEKAKALSRDYKVKGLKCRGCGRIYGENGRKV
jgi:hypothetical protein